MILKAKIFYDRESQTSDSKFRSTAFCKEEASDRASSILVSSLLNFFLFLLCKFCFWFGLLLSESDVLSLWWIHNDWSWAFVFKYIREKTKWKGKGHPKRHHNFVWIPFKNIWVYVKISLSLPFVFVLSLLVGKCFLACLQLLSLCLSCPHSYKHDDDIQGWWICGKKIYYISPL